MIFNDDFNRADSTTVGNGWTELATARSEISGNQLLMTAGGSFINNIVYAPVAADWQNGTVEVDFTITGSNSVPQLHARYNPATGQGYILFFLNNLIRFDANNNGSLSTMDSGSLTLVAGVNYRFSITMDGNNKTGVVRNVDTSTDLLTLVDNVNSTYPNSGSMGLSINTGGDASYDNFVSTELVPPQPAQIVTDEIKNYSGAIQASQSGWLANVYDPATGSLVVRITALSTDVNGSLVISDGAIVIGNTYRVDIDNGSGLFGNKEYVAV